MVYYQKTQPAPACLAVEKAKPNGTYRCEGVTRQLDLDFKGKCYLCGIKGLTSLNIEHLVGHRGNRDAMFSWENLFLSCPHCNGVKNDLRNQVGMILNCTKIDDRVDLAIRFRINPFPGENAEIEAIEDSQAVLNTVRLLAEIFNGDYTEQKEIESGYLREKLLSEIKRFQKLIEKFAELPEENSNELQKIRQRIQKHLSNESAFTAFKRWIIRDDQGLMAEFGSYFS
ncbi:MAG: HNH endonuclease [Bacteroidia bacterium]|nr:HNH endonuclease [Bacteroidia bacterium]